MTVAEAKEIVCQAVEEPLFERGVSDSRIRRCVLARAALDSLVAELARKDEALSYYADERNFNPAGDGWTLLDEADRGSRARAALGEQP